MATTFKKLKPEDKILTRNVLHEAIPITGSILSGTYGTFVETETSIKNYSHGMFQSVYDYPYLSSSANHIFDITVGNSGLSGLTSSLSGALQYQMGYATNTTAQASTRHNIYAQMAQVLCGHDNDGAIRPFDVSGSLSSDVAEDKMEDVFFLNFARLLTKDEIKKGTFELEIGTNATYTTPFTTTTAKITDTGAASSYKVNSPAGEFGILQIADATGSSVNATANCGLIFYQAGIVVLTGSIFQLYDAENPAAGIAIDDFNGTDEGLLSTAPDMNAAVIPMDGALGAQNLKVREMMAQSSISSSADALRHRIKNISFNNTTELNSTVYFCRANAHEFNYSSNPTYLNGSEIRVRPAANADAEPVAYVTTVGLYGPNNELLAVAKTSEPLKKSPSNELTLRVRLDY